MNPRTLSATSLSVAMACPARYRAEFIERAPQFAGQAAGLGSALHNALEEFIGGVKIRRDTMWSIDVLLKMFDESFGKIFGDLSKPEYKDGRAILVKWFSRPYIFEDICGSETISLEHKDNFDVPVVIDGVKTTKPFTFIIDRLDKIGPGEYRVVDYKSQRVPVTAEDLYGKIQARAYALAVMIKYKDAEKIWVQFDLLRHEAVGAVFTRADNIDSWRMIKRAAQEIIDTPDDEVQERLNPECMYCIRKLTCETMKKNADNGGIMGLTLDDMALKFADVQAQLKALQYASGDLEKALLMHASENDILNFDTKWAKVKVSSSMRRSVDEDKVRKIVPPEVLMAYGNKTTMGAVDEMLNGDELTSGQKAALRALIIKKNGDLKVKVTKL